MDGLFFPLVHLPYTRDLIRNHGSVIRCQCKIETTQVSLRIPPLLPHPLQIKLPSKSPFLAPSKELCYPEGPCLCLPEILSMCIINIPGPPVCVCHQHGHLYQAAVGPPDSAWCHLPWCYDHDDKSMTFTTRSFLSNFGVTCLWCLPVLYALVLLLGPWAMWGWAALSSQQSLWLGLGDEDHKIR